MLHRVVRMDSWSAGGIAGRLPEIRPSRSHCVPVCHALLSSSTDTDSERRRPTPGRWLNQSTALSGECSDMPVATTPRRRAGIRLVQWVRWPVTYLPTSALPFSPARSL